MAPESNWALAPFGKKVAVITDKDVDSKATEVVHKYFLLVILTENIFIFILAIKLV